MSDLTHYKDVFEKLSSHGFEINSPLTWSFFFISNEKAKIEKVIKELDGFNYITSVAKEGKIFKLKADKVEILIPEKLIKRNNAFAELAEYCDVEFDGWEVSKQEKDLN